MTEYKHCTNCIYFNTKKPEKCKQFYWTGVGGDNPMARDNYPNSYARHILSNMNGCGYYCFNPDVRRNIYKKMEGDYI